MSYAEFYQNRATNVEYERITTYAEAKILAFYEPVLIKITPCEQHSLETSVEYGKNDMQSLRA
jgi:hypothetical protein